MSPSKTQDLTPKDDPGSKDNAFRDKPPCCSVDYTGGYSVQTKKPQDPTNAVEKAQSETNFDSIGSSVKQNQEREEPVEVEHSGSLSVAAAQPLQLQRGPLRSPAQRSRPGAFHVEGIGGSSISIARAPGFLLEPNVEQH